MKLLTPDDVSQLLQINSRTLANWRSRRQGPAYVRIGGCVRYPEAAVQRYVAGGAVTMPGENDARALHGANAESANCQ